MIIRDASADDMAAIQNIYAHHVLHGTGTFEEVPPAVSDMTDRWRAVSAAGLPWLVAEQDNQIAGYSYAQRYHARSAWRFTVEDAIYIAPEFMRRGIGVKLLQSLVERCAGLGYREMIAVIGDSANAGSIGVHGAAGFVHAGLLRNVGFKFGVRRDVVLMQHTLKT